ncbi:Phenylalanyl-tRNA synthetase alpha chain [Labilithrix luteola]|uniref:Phenylalanyl-tRNA synthetase alpha chain n=1 Tax=Labilithrix luteola TaxID=1391654 RepID=A0A0K1QCF8_9BACT|nr:hypothetical protein [Labilithrix luteola]AKV03466.1 Phenylalanyl-tRNA synthetase alpha chain [Labilithrix luteola]
MKIRLIGQKALDDALVLRDLTDPEGGAHAMQSLVAQLASDVGQAQSTEPRRVRGARVVSVLDNYDRLGFAPESVTRDARYTRYVTHDRVLRTHTSAMIPEALRGLAESGEARSLDVTMLAPGVVYRRDCIDRLHSGEPHQVDVWRVRRGGKRLDRDDLRALIAVAMESLLPGWRWRTTDAVHPYTLEGLQVDVEHDDQWIEVGECGLAHPRVLELAGLDRDVSGLAMGLGLDRLLMLRKGIPDIRLLRSSDPRIASQMLDLEPYRAVSSYPAIRRDMSIAVPADTTPEELGDRVRLLGTLASYVEEIEVVSETPARSLPPQAQARLGLLPGQKNVLLRIVVRSHERTLTHPEANEVRNAIYRILHEGAVNVFAS